MGIRKYLLIGRNISLIQYDRRISVKVEDTGLLADAVP